MLNIRLRLFFDSFQIIFLMQFDILNELLSSTVQDLFNPTQKVTIECKPKVRELQGLIKQQNINRRSAINPNDSFSLISQGSSRDSSTNKPAAPKYKTVKEWMEKESKKRLEEAFKKLGLDQTLMKNSKKAELQQYLETMTVESLGNEKKKVKNQLKSYDNDFNSNFSRQPNHQQKQPLRPLYVYYKKLKQALNKRGGQQLSQQKIEQLITNIKAQRKKLRQQIENYQKQFEQINNRRIRFVRDIAPIQAEYKKYKELKVDLQKYEEMLNK